MLYAIWKLSSILSAIDFLKTVGDLHAWKFSDGPGKPLQGRYHNDLSSVFPESIDFRRVLKRARNAAGYVCNN
jgi:hypothetical protein